MIALFVVLLGTIYPIFSRAFFDQFISIGPEYYNKIFTVLVLPFLVFLSLSNKLNFLQNISSKKVLNRSNLLILGASTLITSLVFFYETRADFLQIIVLFLAVFSSVTTLFIGKNLAMKLAHFGFCLIIVGVVLTSSFGLSKEVNLQQNQSLKIANYQIKFSQISYTQGKNFINRQGIFAIFKNDQQIGELVPALRYYPVSKQTTNEAAIRHGAFDDIYLVIGNKDETENYAVRAYYKPFIYLIWLGCFLIFSSTIFKILSKKS
jgi:cytochrome c-type biogenesis protein CcmF